MATPFDRVLKEFKTDLAQHEIDDFNFTTAADLKTAISKLQEKQASEKRMQNLRRLNSFVEAMDQYDKVVSVFLNATDYLGFIWACIHPQHTSGLVLTFEIGPCKIHATSRFAPDVSSPPKRLIISRWLAPKPRP